MKQEYEAPTIEIIEFEVEDSIASSGNYGGGAIGTEGLFD